jgi:hypothetical protein
MCRVTRVSMLLDEQMIAKMVLELSDGQEKGENQ